MGSIVNEIDSYIKKTIINSVKDFKKYENRKLMKEISLESICEDLNSKETALVSTTDNYAVFSLHLEEIVQDEKFYNILKNLTEQEKEICICQVKNGPLYN